MPLRVLLGAFGDPGHAFPMIALGRALHERGHDVTLQTWERWRTAVEGEGLEFAAAPEYSAFPVPLQRDDQPPQPLGFYEAIVYATRDTLGLVEDLRPDVVVHDILTLAPSLCAELLGIPAATLVPHVFPESSPGFPIYSFGALLPRTPLGRAFWSRAHRQLLRGLQSGRDALNETRAVVGLPPLERVHGGTSERLALVATYPQLEYPRRWPEHVHVVGPLIWEPPAREVPIPPGEGPLVLVAPSTSQDPEHRLLHACLEGLSEAPVRVLATYNRRLPSRPVSVPDNARVVDWLSYSRTLPHCDAIVCHAGHGTLVRALSLGVPVVACPVAGDMNENAARLAWAGAGVRLPRRFISARPIRRAVECVVGDEAIRARARAFAEWSADNDSGAYAAALVESLASSGNLPERSRLLAGSVTS
ncbi:MAG TPA: nucleotide disphospho-sugar-binding domain-containing protein [Solirubrobacteraceae bacterium]|nr:nucleotide disphospho-sugar-binding domain-containing protein [Solirubrobacteraceae bacterium]